MRLAEKTAIVTGAGRGIGQAVALRLAEDGAGVTCADIDADSAAATAQAIQDAGGRSIAVDADVSTEAGNQHMVEQTVANFGGLDDLPAYGAMKGGVRALVRAVATGHGPENIRCNAICPGDVDTPMGAEFFDHQPDPAAARQEILDRYPLRRFATPRDIANVAAFLASDDASYLTGIDLVVDGGLLARVY